MLSDKNIVLGVTGGIAAYKAADLASKLAQAGARVRVIMTHASLEFITPLTFEVLTGNPVVTDMFQTTPENRINHIALSEEADVIVIAPATANILARIACGLADDMLTTTVLAAQSPVVVVPAMHTAMWQNPVTRENTLKLQNRGFHIIEPSVGRLASGGFGEGRFPDTETIIGQVRKVLGQKGDLAGKYIVVTAGGTQEPIDPVRVISNRSSGKMGYALAEAARDRGANVTLVTAPTALAQPAGIAVAPVETAAQMKEAVDKAVAQADVLIMAAAVADYQVAAVAADKIKKEKGRLTLDLVNTPDILAEVTGNFIRVGFAAESRDLIANASRKLDKKNLDLIVANEIAGENSVFGADTNKVTLIGKETKPEDLPLLSKREAADRILDRIVSILESEKRKHPSFPAAENFEISVRQAYLAHNYLHIPSEKKGLFPSEETQIEMETDTGLLQVKYYIHADDNRGFSTGMNQWFKAHNLKPGQQLRITVLDPMHRYRLEIAENDSSQ
ncbi:MAG: bifunctional phosphopantothenoylcysteine decarboxylase/phosphopantothenate--cysteine ligase CoaBC [Dehalococcoidales bacterium]|nr:bifunctional phosphopantothenoylcysteine decarboxylase/phosphopantothenate--cysteine ligase CoaBC [Dehalococcoidales bacterium]